MKKFDRFTLTSFIGPFVAILAVVIFILMMQFLWLYIDELVGKGLGLRIILEFMMWGGATILPLALPLATLLASMMVIGQMAENNELMAIKCAGVSFGRIIAPLVAASAIIAVGAFFIGDRLVPKAYDKIYTLRDDIGRTKDEIKIPSGTFYNGIDGYILRVDSQNKKTGMLYGVMVYDHTGKKGNTSVTMADSSIIKMSKGKDYLTFTMFNGSNYQETNDVNYRDTSLVLQHIDFDRQDLIIQLANYKFEQSDSTRFGDQVNSMSRKQLKHEGDSLKTYMDSLHTVEYNSLRRSSSLLMFKQLDTAFRSPERARFKFADYPGWKDYTAEADAYRKAYDDISSFNGEMNNYNFSVYEQSYFIRHIDTAYLRKYAQALACLILFFIGAPLGSLIRKGGLGTSAIIAALFFVLYWVVDISGARLAYDGAVDPTSGAFISSYVLLPIGMFLSWKAFKDSSIFDMDQFKSWWRMLKSKITRVFHPVRIVYMGTPEFAVKPLDTLINAKYRVVGVVTVADKPSGRGLKTNESAVKQYALAHGIPVLQPEKLKDPKFLADLKGWKPDLFVVVAFRMLPEEVWSMPKLGTVNLHAALLPQYRGAAPINWAVINGEKMTGVTTFMIDKSIDTGGIIMRQECRIRPDETAGELHDELMGIGADLVLQTVEGLIQHNVELRVQKSFIQGSEVLKPAPKLSKELCHIDWASSTEEVYNLIRGLSPYPAAFTELILADSSPDHSVVPGPAPDASGSSAVAQGSSSARLAATPQVLKIYKAEKVDLHGFPGQILSDGKTFIAIATSDGAISIKDIQLSGKKRMEVKAFLLGFREPQSFRCV